MATTTGRQSLLAVPQPLVKLFAYFPLKTYPPSKPEKVPIVSPILWIHPPLSLGQGSTLSADIECLKWQAHVALRGFRNFFVRWDISQDGALDGRLPNLQIPSGDADSTLLAAHNIPTWIDENIGALDELEGYKDVESRDESHAWIALLEGDIHAALVSLSTLLLWHFLYDLQLGICPTSTFFLLS
jgi:metaxin